MLARILSLLLALAYPVIVFLSLSFWELNSLSVVLVLLGAGRILLRQRSDRGGMEAVLSGALLILLGVLLWWSQAELSVRLYPVIVNASLLLWFGWSLFRPPTIIERIARATEPELPDHAITYTRNVTIVWCLFFFINGLAALYTSLYSSLQIWTLYNGLIAYLLMGALLVIEYLIRRRTRQQHEDGVD